MCDISTFYFSSLVHSERRLGKARNADLFVKYAEKITKELGDYADIICTINEANLTSCFTHSFPNYPPDGIKTFLPFVDEAAKSCGSNVDNFGPFCLATL